MPNRDEHITRAEQNEEFARSLDLAKTFYVDWAVTLLFYSALHYVDAYLAAKPIHPPNHDMRDSAIEGNGSLSPIYNDYRRLKDRSEAARYAIANFDRSQFPPIERSFAKIKALVLAKLR